MPLKMHKVTLSENDLYQLERFFINYHKYNQQLKHNGLPVYLNLGYKNHDDFNKFVKKIEIHFLTHL